MKTRLTLKLDKYVINKAKEYAAARQRSLSGIVESYLRSLINQSDPDNPDDIQISSFVKSMSSGVSVPVDIDYKKEYSEYLSGKVLSNSNFNSYKISYHRNGCC